jgi:putative peptidoglycan lipid II flippase
MTLLRNAATVGGWAMTSRGLGFIRDVLMASTIGTGPVAQAFVMAFRLPHLFRTLLAEGAFNASFVPLFARRYEGGGFAPARGMAEDVFGVLFAALLVLTALAQMAMPGLMHVLAPGFVGDPERFDLAVAYTRISAPYLLFMTLTAVLGGMLNSLRRFAAAAAAPIVLNVVMIATLALAAALDWGNSSFTGYALIWSMSLAGLFQFFLVAFACRRAGMGLILRWPRLTPDVSELLKLALPGLIAGGITQVNVLISAMIATGMDRAVSYLYYAERLYQLPLGVIGVAIGIVLLPEMARRLRSGDVEGALANQNRALEFAMFVTLPATAILTAMPFALTSTFFEHGAFSSADAAATAAALASFAIGLPAFTLYKVFSPGFFARSDTKWPMYVAFCSVAFNILGSLTLPHYLGHIGLALANALAAWVNTGLLAFILIQRGHYAPDGRLKRRLPRIVLASAVMALCLWFGFLAVEPVFLESQPIWLRALATGGLVSAGVACYAIASHYLGAMTWTEARRMVRRP